MKQMRARMAKRAVVAAALLWASAPLQAIGMRTKFGQVIVNGVKIGQTYSLNNLIKLPLRLINTGDRTETLRIDIIPVKGAVVPGYEPIPDTSWLKLEKQDFTVEPNHEAVTDVIISIPNDPQLLGRRFEAMIWSHTTTKQGVYNVGLQSQLLLGISSVLPSEEELKKKFVDHQAANLDFTLFPTDGLAEDLPLGREIDLKKERKLSIKLVNPNDARLHFKIRSVPNWESQLELPEGFTDSPDFKWVRPSTDTVTVAGNSIKETALLINIPDKDEYRGHAYLFPVQVEILEQEIAARVYYKLYIKTQKKPQPEKTPEHKEK